MTSPQTSKQRVFVVIAFVSLTLITLMCLVYGLVQRTEALKMHELVIELKKKNMELTVELQKAQETIVAVRELSEKNLQTSIEKSKRN